MSAHLVDRLRAGRLDLVVLFLPAEVGRFPIVTLGPVPLHLALPAGRATDPLSLAALRNEGWISFPPSNPGRGWLQSACAKVGLVPRITHEVENLIQAKAFIAAGLGISLMPAAASRAGGERRSAGTCQPHPGGVDRARLCLRPRPTLPRRGRGALTARRPEQGLRPRPPGASQVHQ